MNKNLAIMLPLTFMVTLFFKAPEDMPKSAPQPAGIKVAPQRVKVWVNAFIPKDIPGQTVSVTGPGPHFGKTALSFGNYFLTDQRSFSADINASHRMQTVVNVDFTTKSVQGASNCNETVRLGDNFLVECQQTATASNLLIKSISVGKTPDGKDGYYFTIEGGAKNPCVAYTPNAFVPEINWKLIVFVLKDSNDKISIGLDGTIEPFPAFEMYASVDNAAAKQIFTNGIGTSARPYFLPNLPGGFSMPADVTVNVPPKLLN